MLVKKIVRGNEEAYFYSMSRILPYRKAFIKGAIIILGLAILFIKMGYIIIDPLDVSLPIYFAINILGFGASWVILSLLIHKFSVYKVLGVLSLLVVAVGAEIYLDVRDNPITIPLIILFWVGIAYLVLPQFFKKYQFAILSVYGLVISYYFFVFHTMANDGVGHRQDFAASMLFPLPVFAALWGYEQWRWLKTLKADKAKAELSLLKSQINPHFFFNTLNNLYGLVVEKSEEAPAVVLKLSDMMRYTIYEGKEEVVSLTDEVSYLETYIELHNIRYQKKMDLQFTHDIDSGIKVAPLLFIILLENAFKHGVESLRKDAYIHIHLKTQDNQVFFTLENNYEPKTSPKKAGIGLDNLKRRLTHIYPNRHELKIEKTADTYTAQLNLILHP